MTTREELLPHITVSGEHWLWTDKTNYGAAHGAPRHNKLYVRNEMWTLYRTEPLASGTPLLAACGVGKCVRPEHLGIAPAAGTQRSANAERRTTIELLESIDRKLDMLLDT